jgi:hypothetical protein
MIFQYTWEKVLAGQKTQTRRIKKPGETLWHRNDGADFVTDGNGRKKWQVGKTYAVQPGRGKPGIGRIRITAILEERVQDITREDAVAEGCAAWPPSEDLNGLIIGPVGDFMALWNSIHSGPTHWAANPDLWVLEFERVPEPEPA